MIFNPYALIDLAGSIVIILLLSSIYKAIYDKKLKIITLHLYLSAALMIFSEFLAVSLEMKKHYDLIITLIDLETFFGASTVTFLFYFIVYITKTKINKILYYSTLLMPFITLISIIFFHGKYTIIGLKKIPTGYFGIYGFLIDPIEVIYVLILCFFIVVLLIKRIKTTLDIFLKTRLKNISTGLIIFLTSVILFFLIQTYLDTYYLSVGGINFFVIFLAFLCFILINRDLANINIILQSKILYPVVYAVIVLFFVFLSISIKKLWDIFINDSSPISFFIFMIFITLYLFPLYNKFITVINKLLYKTPLNLIESSQTFSNLLTEIKDPDGLRENLWRWFEENLLLESLAFYKIEKNKMILIKELGSKGSELRITKKKDIKYSYIKKLVPDKTEFAVHKSQLFFIIKYNNIPLEIISIKNIENKPFTQYDLEILKIILLKYRSVYINLYLNEQLLIKSKLDLLSKLSKNFKNILKKTKIEINDLKDLTTPNIVKPKQKKEIIKRINDIIKKLKVAN